MPRTSPTAQEAFVEDVEKKGIDLTRYEGLIGLYREAEAWRENAMLMWTGKKVPTPWHAYERCQQFVISPATEHILSEDVTRRLMAWVRASLEELEYRREDIRETLRLVRSMLRRTEWRLGYYRRQLRRAREQYERTRHWYYEVETRYYERIVRELEEQVRNLRNIVREYEHTLKSIERILEHRRDIEKILEEYHGIYDKIHAEVLERASLYARDIANARAAVLRAVTDIVNRGYATWDEIYTLAWIGYYLGRIEWYYDILKAAALQTRPEIAERLRTLEELGIHIEQAVETAPQLQLIPTEVVRTERGVEVRYGSGISGLTKTIRLRAEPVKLFDNEIIVSYIKERDEIKRRIRYRIYRVRLGLTISNWAKCGQVLLTDTLPSLVQLYRARKQQREDILRKIAEAITVDHDMFRRMFELVYGSLGIPIEVVHIRLKSGRVDTLIKIGLRHAPQLYIYSKYRKSVMKAETWESCSDEEVRLAKMPLPSLGITLWFPAGDYIVHDIYSEAKLGRVWFTWAIDADGRKRIIDELKRQSILVVKTPGGYFYFLDIMSKSPNKILKIAHKLEKTYGDIGHKRAAYVRQRAGSQAWGVIRIAGKYGSHSESRLEIVYERPSQYSELEEWKTRIIRLITGEYIVKTPELYARELCYKLGNVLTPDLLPAFTIRDTLTQRMVDYAKKLIEQIDDEDLVKLMTCIGSLSNA